MAVAIATGTGRCLAEPAAAGRGGPGAASVRSACGRGRPGGGDAALGQAGRLRLGCVRGDELRCCGPLCCTRLEDKESPKEGKGEAERNDRVRETSMAAFYPPRLTGARLTGCSSCSNLALLPALLPPHPASFTQVLVPVGTCSLPAHQLS